MLFLIAMPLHQTCFSDKYENFRSKSYTEWQAKRLNDLHKLLSAARNLESLVPCYTSDLCKPASFIADVLVRHHVLNDAFTLVCRPTELPVACGCASHT